jgi:hypothetical protein
MMFVYTGKKQTFKVPSGVTQIRVIAVGGDGGGSVFGHGGRVSAVIPVTPSETLAIYVGGTGGTQYAGGSGGKADNPGETGELGSGGAGGSGCDYPTGKSTSGCGASGGGGGGGGGGFYGGGGGGGGFFYGCCGSSGGGGGGGSSYVESSASNVHFWQGWKHGHASVVIFDW